MAGKPSRALPKSRFPEYNRQNTLGRRCMDRVPVWFYAAFMAMGRPGHQGIYVNGVYHEGRHGPRLPSIITASACARCSTSVIKPKIGRGPAGTILKATKAGTNPFQLGATATPMISCRVARRGRYRSQRHALYRSRLPNHSRRRGMDASKQVQNRDVSTTLELHASSPCQVLDLGLEKVMALILELVPVEMRQLVVEFVVAPRSVRGPRRAPWA